MLTWQRILANEENVWTLKAQNLEPVPHRKKRQKLDSGKPKIIHLLCTSHVNFKFFSPW